MRTPLDPAGVRLLRWSGTFAALLAILLASGTHWVALQNYLFPPRGGLRANPLRWLHFP